MSFFRWFSRRFLPSKRRKPFGETVMIAVGAQVDGTCELGKYVNVARGAQLTRHCVIGDRSSIGRDSKLQSVKMGKFCSVSWNVSLGAPSHPMSCMSMHAFTCQKRFGIADENVPMRCSSGAVEIGNDVWIGCHAVVLSGVKIGDGAVIGAGAVVTHDVAPYAVVAGVPARYLRSRFPDKLISRLLELRWWDWPDEKLRSELDKGLFCQELTMDVLDRFEFGGVVDKGEALLRGAIE